MKFRWTIKDLVTQSDYEVLRGIVEERRSVLNPYTPLAERLRELSGKLTEGKRLTKKKN